MLERIHEKEEFQHMIKDSNTTTILAGTDNDKNKS
jgi:hypothetical protein